jgi:hypothetical protein
MITELDDLGTDPLLLDKDEFLGRSEWELYLDHEAEQEEEEDPNAAEDDGGAGDADLHSTQTFNIASARGAAISRKFEI